MFSSINVPQLCSEEIKTNISNLLDSLADGTDEKTAMLEMLDASMLLSVEEPAVLRPVVPLEDVDRFA